VARSSHCVVLCRAAGARQLNRSHGISETKMGERKCNNNVGGAQCEYGELTFGVFN